MNSKSKKFKDTYAAPGSSLYKALEEGDQKKAAQIYKETGDRMRTLSPQNKSKTDNET
jgi:hypothetical protein